MGSGDAEATRIRAVGAIIVDDEGRLLLIQRGHAPAKGLWSIPGGRVEPGETDQQALTREIAEETGLTVTVGALAGVVTRPGRPGTVYEIHDYDATLADGTTGAAQTAAAADDAADLRWVDPEHLHELPLTPGLVEALRDWGRLT